MASPQRIAQRQEKALAKLVKDIEALTKAISYLVAQVQNIETKLDSLNPKRTTVRKAVKREKPGTK